MVVSEVVCACAGLCLGPLFVYVSITSFGRNVLILDASDAQNAPHEIPQFAG